jgi:hypothetical protein
MVFLFNALTILIFKFFFRIGMILLAGIVIISLIGVIVYLLLTSAGPRKAEVPEVPGASAVVLDAQDVHIDWTAAQETEQMFVPGAGTCSVNHIMHGFCL